MESNSCVIRIGLLAFGRISELNPTSHESFKVSATKCLSAHGSVHRILVVNREELGLPRMKEIEEILRSQVLDGGR